MLFVQSNEIQLKLFEEAPFRPLPADHEQITWWLMIHTDGKGVLRAELSLPIGLGEDRRMAVWQERIVLDVPELDPTFGMLPGDDEPPFDVEVAVRSKKS